MPTEPSHTMANYTKDIHRAMARLLIDPELKSTPVAEMYVGGRGVARLANELPAPSDPTNHHFRLVLERT